MRKKAVIRPGSGSATLAMGLALVALIFSPGTSRSQNDRSRSLQLLDDQGVFVGIVILEQDRTHRGGHALGVNHVFDKHGNAAEGADKARVLECRIQARRLFENLPATFWIPAWISSKRSICLETSLFRTLRCFAISTSWRLPREGGWSSATMR